LAVQLTKRQHTIPRRSIGRFYNGSCSVWVKLRSGKIFNARSDNEVFCAKRAWEERSENGHKINIEDVFQEVADKICSGEVTTLNQARSDCVSAMFALWIARSHLAEKPLPGVSAETLYGLSTEELRDSNLVKSWNPDERDQLEKAGRIVNDPDGAIPGRMQAWPFMMQRYIGPICAKLRGIRWGILRAEEDEFLLPDRIREHCLLPLSPKILLVAGHSDDVLAAAGVAKINQIAKSDFREWLISKTEFPT